MRPDWLEQVWMEVADEVTYESKHPQYQIADCGCVYHAEEGIPCPHDLALMRERRSDR